MPSFRRVPSFSVTSKLPSGRKPSDQAPENPDATFSMRIVPAEVSSAEAEVGWLTMTAIKSEKSAEYLWDRIIDVSFI